MVPGGSFSYDANDRIGGDTFDANGNTISSAGISYGYDFENRLLMRGAVTIVYDGDGNRVSETAGGVTTKYLVDTLNPTGYAQVMDELANGAVTRTYAYGLRRISEDGYPCIPNRLRGFNVSLVQKLAHKGERDAAISYLAQCQQVWSHQATKLNAWIDAIRANQEPTFSDSDS